jgi:membrane-anchored glycerophosphoryl diester phosphodiesterase (GDPDase)
LGAQPQPLPTTPIQRGEPAAAVTVGSLVSRTFSTWWANVARFALLLLLGYTPMIVAGIVGALFFGVRIFPAARPGGAPQFPPGVMPTLLAVVAVTLVLAMVVFGGMTYGALQHLAGKPFTFGSMLRAGLRRAWPLFLVGTVAYVLVLLGMIALIVPGIIVGIALSVALPIVVAEERAGVGQTIKRSFALTKGSRGTIFGAMLVVFLALWAASLVGNLATAAVASNQPLAIVGFTLSMIVQLAMAPLTFVLCAVAYHDLRVAKEGVDTGNLAAVFE